MSCKDCDEFQDGDTTMYYRWRYANIEIRACRKHALEVFDALNKAQGDVAEVSKKFGKEKDNG